MPLVRSTLTRLMGVWLPAFALALSVAWSVSVTAQDTTATQRLFQAVDVNDMNAVKGAISAGADLGAKNANGKTAADIAVDKGHFIIAHYLLSQRSAKNTAKRLNKTATSEPKDRLRKPSTKRSLNPSGPVKAQAKPATTKPRKLAPARSDSPTRVTEILEPVAAKNKPQGLAEAAKKNRYGLPPRKPGSPRQRAEPIRQVVAVAPSPGVVAPSSDAPKGAPSTDSPRALGDAAPGDDNALDDLMAEETLVENSPEPAKHKNAAINPTGQMGSFFRSLFDLVTSDDAANPKPKPEIAAAPTPKVKSQPTKSRDARPNTKNTPALTEPERADDPISDGLSDTLDSSDDLVGPAELDDPSDLPEMAAEADVNDAMGLDELADGPEPNIAQEPRGSASARTLDRIKNLLGDGPAEDEFGLPTVEIPTRETASGEDAVDRVLGRLDDSEESANGFLDDRPGPETGPDLIPIEGQGTVAPISDALRARLRRLGDAVTRNVVVDTDSILQQGRERAANPLADPLEKRPTVPSQSRQLVPEPVAKPPEGAENQIRRRQTARERFAERLKGIRELEQLREDPFGLPVGGDRDPVSRNKTAGPVMETTPDTPTAVTKSSVNGAVKPAKESEILDRVVGFFGSPQNQQKSPGPEVRDFQGQEYIQSPNAREVTEPGPPPEIENLETFDQDDETKPQQNPGSLQPVFLDRLAGLFNEEETNQTDGWKAEVSRGNPFPGRGELVNKTGSNPWTTTVEVNVGENKAPLVIQLAQSAVAEAAEPDEQQGQTVNAPAGQKATVRPSNGKRSEMAKKAYGDPLREPDANQAAVQQKTFFGRLTKLFQPKDPIALERESLLLEQDEKLSTAHDASDGSVKVASRSEGDAKTYWPITQLTKSDTPISGHRRPDALTRTSLTDVTLTLGESVHLDNIFPPGRDGTDPNNECVKKNRGTTLFCIEPIDWPQDLRQSFIITTILYTGSMAIVRYDQAVATRLHTLFQTSDFEKISAYYQNRFGEPTEILKRSIAPLAQPRQDNPTLSWRSRDQKTNAITVLEIRKFDDTRGGFPDTNRGAVMLYFTTSPSIFPQVSAHELMRLKRIVDVTQSEVEKNAGETAAPVSGPTGAAVSEDELFGSEPVVDENQTSPVDATLEALPGEEPDQLFSDETPEKPEDILNEPDLLEPNTDGQELVEPDLLAPEENSRDRRATGGLDEEPITDEQPDEIIEILPRRTGNNS